MHIEVYGRPMCDACEATINLIERVGVAYNYHNIEQMSSDELTELMTRKSPETRTVPIIFVDGRQLGDINELREFFEFKGKSTEILG